MMPQLLPKKIKQRAWPRRPTSTPDIERLPKRKATRTSHSLQQFERLRHKAGIGSFQKDSTTAEIKKNKTWLFAKGYVYEQHGTYNIGSYIISIILASISLVLPVGPRNYVMFGTGRLFQADGGWTLTPISLGQVVVRTAPRYRLESFTMKRNPGHDTSNLLLNRKSTKETKIFTSYEKDSNITTIKQNSAYEGRNIKRLKRGFGGFSCNHSFALLRSMN
jgi:hypothetical protein